MPTLRKTPSNLRLKNLSPDGGAGCHLSRPMPRRGSGFTLSARRPNEGRHHRSESRNRFGVCPAAAAAGRLGGGGGEVSAAGEWAAPPGGGFSAHLANLQLRRRRGSKRSSVRRLTELPAGRSADQQRGSRRGAGDS